MKVVLFGATGFVGANLQDYLKSSHDVASMRVCYIPNQRFEIDCFKNKSFTQIFKKNAD
jgi:dTDP-4-dehydrorhamnose reductase